MLEISTNRQRAASFNTASIAAFRLRLGLQGKAENTLKAYCSDLSLFLAESGMDEIPLEELEDMAMAWLQIARHRKKAAKTINRRVTSLKAWAATMAGMVILQEYRGPESAPGIPHPLPEGIEGITRMIEAARRPTHKALVALCGLAGCRVSEALTIRPSNIDGREMVLRIIYGKGDKERYVPISYKAWDVLLWPVVNNLGSDEPLVPFAERFARKIVTELGLRAKLSRHVASHDLRMTFATSIYDATGDMVVVQKLLGHANLATTQGYVGIEFQKMRDAVNRI